MTPQVVGIIIALLVALFIMVVMVFMLYRWLP